MRCWVWNQTKTCKNMQKPTYRWVSCTMPEIRSAVYSWDALFWAVKRVERNNLQQEPFFITFQDSLPLSGPFGGPRFAMAFARVATCKWRPWGLGSKIYLPPFLCGELIDFQNVPSIILEEDKSFLGWIEDNWRQNAAKNWVGGRSQMSSCFARHFERELRLAVGWFLLVGYTVYAVDILVLVRLVIVFPIKKHNKIGYPPLWDQSIKYRCCFISYYWDISSLFLVKFG